MNTGPAGSTAADRPARIAALQRKADLAEQRSANNVSTADANHVVVHVMCQLSSDDADKDFQRGMQAMERFRGKVRRPPLLPHACCLNLTPMDPAWRRVPSKQPQGQSQPVQPRGAS